MGQAEWIVFKLDPEGDHPVGAVMLGLPHYLCVPLFIYLDLWLYADSLPGAKRRYEADSQHDDC